MISAMRDQVLALACVRHGVPAREGRGLDLLPRDVTLPLEQALVRRLDRGDLAGAFQAATAGLLVEMRSVDADVSGRLEHALLELSGGTPASSP